MFIVRGGYRKGEGETKRGGRELGRGLREKGIWDGFINAVSHDHEKTTLLIIS